MCVLTGLRDEQCDQIIRWFFRASVSDYSIFRLCRLLITLLSSPSASQFLLPFSGSFISFLPPSRPILYHPPYFTRRRLFAISLHPLISPHLAWAPSDRPHGRPPPPRLPASTARLSFPPLLGSPRSCVVYVDDCLFWEHSQYEIDNVMKYFKEDVTS